MHRLLEISKEELELVIQNASEKLHMSAAVVEKDFWVCMILKYLFNDFKYKDYIVFKGGTSLSKVFGLIERFSEDIDLALDWSVLGYGSDEPYKNRSNTQQIKFNQKMNDDTKIFLRDVVLPILNEDFKAILKYRKFNFYIDESDGQTICFDYPKYYSDNAIIQVARLEIGALAEPIPASAYKISTYIEDAYPNLFNENINVIAVDSLRTFFEKITILHREANRTNGHYPPRYSRHYYDVYKMIRSDIREKSLRNIDLLKNVIDFKNKFYACKWAGYDEIMKGNLKLVPSDEALEMFSNDYDKMKNMLFGEKIPFNDIIEEIKKYEVEIGNEIRKSNHFVLE